jgi:hypothetical protein
VRAVWHCGWRGNLESNERSIRPINNVVVISGFADVTAVIFVERCGRDVVSDRGSLTLA